MNKKIRLLFLAMLAIGFIVYYKIPREIHESIKLFDLTGVYVNTDEYRENLIPQTFDIDISVVERRNFFSQTTYTGSVRINGKDYRVMKLDLSPPDYLFLVGKDKGPAHHQEWTIALEEDWDAVLLSGKDYFAYGPADSITKAIHKYNRVHDIRLQPSDPEHIFAALTRNIDRDDDPESIRLFYNHQLRLDIEDEQMVLPYFCVNQSLDRCKQNLASPPKLHFITEKDRTPPIVMVETAWKTGDAGTARDLYLLEYSDERIHFIRHFSRNEKNRYEYTLDAVDEHTFTLRIPEIGINRTIAVSDPGSGSGQIEVAGTGDYRWKDVDGDGGKELLIERPIRGEASAWLPFSSFTFVYERRDQEMTFVKTMEE